jgi:hypothetical protein
MESLDDLHYDQKALRVTIATAFMTRFLHVGDLPIIMALVGETYFRQRDMVTISTRALQEASGIAQLTLYRGLARLAEAGFVEIIQPKNANAPKSYRINLENIVAEGTEGQAAYMRLASLSKPVVPPTRIRVRSNTTMPA